MNKYTSSNINNEINVVRQPNKAIIENVESVQQPTSNSQHYVTPEFIPKQKFAPLFPRIK